MLKTLTY